MERGTDRACGILQAERQGLYTVFRAQVDTEALCRLYAMYEGGEAVLGIPAPEQGRMSLKISVPNSRLPRGKLLRGCLQVNNPGWRNFPGGSVGRFHLPPGYVQKNVYRFPWRAGERLPCDELLCFYRLVGEGERTFLELKLDENDLPQV